MGFKDSRIRDIFGHGMFALQKKAGWFKYFESVGITNPDTIGTMLVLVGIIDIAVAVLVLIKLGPRGAFVDGPLGAVDGDDSLVGWPGPSLGFRGEMVQLGRAARLALTSWLMQKFKDWFSR